MTAPLSIFLDFNLPNATTWYYFSFLLAVALFFKFSRLLSIRNLDVLLLFLLGPGLLVILAARPQPLPLEKQPAVKIAALVGQGALAGTPELTSDAGVFAEHCGSQMENVNWLWWGYVWVLAGSIFFLCRCLFDLTLVQRPALAPNLQLGGLVWLAGALLICLLAVAYRQVERHMHPSAAPMTQIQVVPGQAVFAVEVLWRELPVWTVAVLAFACHVVVVVGLVLIGWQHFQDLSAGMAAATFYLLLPYTGQHVGQLHHVLPMALFVGVLLAYRLPTLAGVLFGITTAATYFPIFVLPLWLSFYRYRGAGRFLFAFALCLGIGLAVIAWALAFNDELDQSIQLALESAAWQPWKVPTGEGFWTGIPWAYRIPVFLLFLSFVVTTMFWPAPKNLAHVIALSCAVFIGLQFWGADQGGTLVLWYMPLLLLLVFRPNLHDRVAPLIAQETDWLSRTLRWLARPFRRFFRKPEVVHTNAA